MPANADRQRYTAERRTEALRLRETGRSWAEVAVILGYPNARAASRDGYRARKAVEAGEIEGPPVPMAVKPQSG